MPGQGDVEYHKLQQTEQNKNEHAKGKFILNLNKINLLRQLYLLKQTEQTCYHIRISRKNYIGKFCILKLRMISFF